MKILGLNAFHPITCVRSRSWCIYQLERIKSALKWSRKQRSLINTEVASLDRHDTLYFLKERPFLAC